MKARHWISALTKRQGKTESKQFALDEVGGYTVTMPPGKALLIRFEGRQGEVMVDYPAMGHPTVAVSNHPDCARETTVMHYRPAEEITPGKL